MTLGVSGSPGPPPAVTRPATHSRGFSQTKTGVPLFGPGGRGTFSWPGAYGTWWQADPENDVILIYLIQNYPDLTSAAAAGNTDLARLQSVQPRFVKRTYAALGL